MGPYQQRDMVPVQGMCNNFVETLDHTCLHGMQCIPPVIVHVGRLLKTHTNVSLVPPASLCASCNGFASAARGWATSIKAIMSCTMSVRAVFWRRIVALTSSTLIPVPVERMLTTECQSTGKGHSEGRSEGSWGRTDQIRTNWESKYVSCGTSKAS